MNIKKIINSALTIMGLALVAVGAQAQTVREFASVTGGDGTFVYTSGAAGGLTMTGTGFLATLDFPKAGTATNNPATVVFTGLQNTGATTTTVFNGSTFFAQNLTGGGFTIYNGNGTTGTVLLAGTFGGASLTGVLGTSQAGVDTNFQNVAYSSGSYLTAGNFMTGAQVADKFNFSLINALPTLAVTGNSLNGFTSAGNGQFTGVTAVPEPATIVPFALGGLALLGLMARKTRRTGGVAA